MKTKHWYILWGCLYILCAFLGFIPDAAGFGKFLLILAAAAFFVPGWVLLYFTHKTGEMTHARNVRTLSLISLGLTLLLLILNFASGHASVAAGSMLYTLLVLFSAPMYCSQYWIASLFLWACLLMTSLSLLLKARKGK